MKQVVIDNKKKIIAAAAVLLSFVFGFSLALVRAAPRSPYGNSTPVKLDDQTQQADGGAGDSTAKSQESTKVAAASPTTGAVAVVPKVDQSCVVKAKKKTTGTSLYYIAGNISYNRVKATDCFKTEAEAQAAGFKKAGG